MGQQSTPPVFYPVRHDINWLLVLYFPMLGGLLAVATALLFLPASAIIWVASHVASWPVIFATVAKINLVLLGYFLLTMALMQISGNFTYRMLNHVKAAVAVNTFSALSSVLWAIITLLSQDYQPSDNLWLLPWLYLTTASWLSAIRAAAVLYRMFAL